MWGTSKQEQLKETPQRMEGGVVINDFYKNIENVLHQKKKLIRTLPLENKK